ncbi:WAT1-related protein [Spatholobus suberectus]|nr:WAT1-related protein [Spatholobus suberectus]
MQGAVTTVMVVVLFLSVGLNTLIKASMSKGMSNFVFVAYSNLLAFCVLLLATTIHHRNRALTPINNSIIFRIFVISLLRYVEREERQNEKVDGDGQSRKLLREWWFFF